jgi:hypothetical protein
MPYHTIPSSRHAMTPPLPCSRRTGHAAATRRHACGHLPPSPVLASSLYGFTLQPVPGQRRLTSPSPRSFSIGGEEARRRGGSDINPPRQSNRGGGFVRPRFHPKTSSNHGGQSSSSHTHTLTHSHHNTTPAAAARGPPRVALFRRKRKRNHGRDSPPSSQEENKTEQPNHRGSQDTHGHGAGKAASVRNYSGLLTSKRSDGISLSGNTCMGVLSC